MSLLSLLICQLKYDLTGRITLPENCFQLKLTNYASDAALTRKILNGLIKELDLNIGFLSAEA